MGKCVCLCDCCWSRCELEDGAEDVEWECLELGQWELGFADGPDVGRTEDG